MSFAESEMSYLSSRDPSIMDPRARPMPAARKNLFKKDSKEKEPVDVYLRIKPQTNGNAFVVPGEPQFSVIGETTLVSKEIKKTSRGLSNVSHSYSFTEIFKGSVNQKEIFDKCALKSVRDLINGHNSLLFAYGTTNAGKTHTIIGNQVDPGIIPRALNTVFHNIQDRLANSCKYKPENLCSVIELCDEDQKEELILKNQLLQSSLQSGDATCASKASSTVNCSRGSFDRDSNEFISQTFREMQGGLQGQTASDLACDDGIVFTVWVCYAEIYNENIYDLLDKPAHGKPRKILKIAADMESNNYIKGLRHVNVRSGDEAYQVMMFGRDNLRCAATQLNDTSSRSHSIFTLKLVISPNTDEPTHAHVSMLSFCDLAGSERAKKTLNQGKRQVESNNINTSLHILGRCLTNIRDNQKGGEQKPIPFRDSKLTRLFKRALGGGERVSMIVNVSTDPLLHPETLNVLHFSAVAQDIKFEPVCRPRRNPLKTRFSVIASKHPKRLTIPWEGETSTVSAADSHAALVQQVQKLQAELRREKLRVKSVDAEVRHQLTEQFSKLMSEADQQHSQHLEEVEVSRDTLMEWRLNQMRKFYEDQRLERAAKCKRKCTEMESDDDDEEEDVAQERDVLRETNANLLAKSQTQTAEITRLGFELSAMRSEHAAALVTLDTLKQSDEHKWEPRIGELEEKVTTVLDSNTKLKELLDEAKQEFDNLSADNKDLRRDLDEADSELQKKEMCFEQQTQQISELSSALSSANQQLDERDQLEEINKALEEANRVLEKQQANWNEDKQLLELSVAALRKEVEALNKQSEAKKQEAPGPDSCETEALQKEVKALLKEVTALNATLAAKEEQIVMLQQAEQELVKDWSSDVKSLQQKYQSEIDGVEDRANTHLNSTQERMTKLTEENEALRDQVAALAADMASFCQRRDKQFKAYDDMLRREREAVEVQKREVNSLQEVLYKKSTPTPNKNEVSQLREEVSRLTAQLTQLSVESTKEKENEAPFLAPHSTRKNQPKKPPAFLSEPRVKKEPASAEKLPKKTRAKKKLFSQTEDVFECASDQRPLEEIVVPEETPADIVKRRLRSQAKSCNQV